MQGLHISYINDISGAIELCNILYKICSKENADRIIEDNVGVSYEMLLNELKHDGVDELKHVTALMLDIDQLMVSMLGLL